MKTTEKFPRGALVQVDGGRTKCTRGVVLSDDDGHGPYIEFEDGSAGSYDRSVVRWRRVPENPLHYVGDAALAKGALTAKRRIALSDRVQAFAEFALLKGAKIVRVGFHPKCREGGFAIDFRHPGGGRQRLVLAYTDLGEWVEYVGPVALPRKRA